MSSPAVRTSQEIQAAESRALALNALDAIAGVTTPEEAESLLARVKVAAEAARVMHLGKALSREWRGVEIKAERKWGELLGEAEHKNRHSPDIPSVRGPDARPATGAEREAVREARKLAAVPAEIVEEYVETAETPSRAGLLREADAKRDKMSVHYSSATDDWATPQALFDVLNREFRFTLDVCALESSAKCSRYFTPEMDGLAHDWTGTCWMNPPYGTEIGRWVEKAAVSSRVPGTAVVCLLPSRVDTGWWWDHCRHAEIRFLRGRLKFGNADTGAPFPSAVVVFGEEPTVVWWEWR